MPYTSNQDTSKQKENKQSESKRYDEILHNDHDELAVENLIEEDLILEVEVKDEILEDHSNTTDKKNPLPSSIKG